MAPAPPLPDSHLRIKAAMAKTAENEQRFRELAELLPETVYEMDMSGHFGYVNAKGRNSSDTVGLISRPGRMPWT